jgi:hypothetical protein
MKIFLILVSFFICGCQSHRIVQSVALDASSVATVVVIKEKAERPGEGGFYFGENKQNYAVLKAAGVKEIQVAAGAHVFEVWSTGSPTFELPVNLEPNSRTCIRVYPNDANYVGKFIVPLLRNATSTFKAEVVPCQ